MGKPSRKNINISATDLESPTVASGTEYDELIAKFLDFTPQDGVNSPNYRSLLLQLKHPEMKISWDESPPQFDGSGIKKGTTTTAPKNKTYNARHFEEHPAFDLRDDRSSFTEDRHNEDEVRTNVVNPGRGSIVPAPPNHHETPARPVWTSVNQPRAPFITFWPVGILMMAVFIVGFVSLLLCRVMATTRPPYNRRNVRPAARPAMSPRSIISDDGGFGDRSRRRADIPANLGSNPPRAATPPPPYPGSPPGSTVYVNPLDTKTCHLFVPSVLSSPRRNCCASPTPSDLELPPPYPGSCRTNSTPELTQQTTATTLSISTACADSTNNQKQTSHQDPSVSLNPPRRTSSNRTASSTTRNKPSPCANLKTVQDPVPVSTINTESNTDTN